MEEMSLDRAKLIDERLTKAKRNYEEKGCASAKFPIKGQMDLIENLEIDKILKNKGYGYVLDGDIFCIYPAGIDFLKCGGFTRLIREQIEAGKHTKRMMDRAKMEPYYRWATWLLGGGWLLKLISSFF